MKKTISITIANTAFLLEDDAYESLKKYLDSVHNYFAHDLEIMNDIENRIAERFSESDSKIITLTQVESVIKDMGTVEQLSENESTSSENDHTHHTSNNRSGSKRLYRNPDGAILAGVASGLGSYFNIDPVFIRVIFVALTFASGIGLIAYIILWAIVPEANTPSAKLEMGGKPVNLATMKTASGKIRAQLGNAAGPLRKMVKFLETHLMKFIRIFTGCVMGAAAFIGIVGITILVGMASSNYLGHIVDPAVIQAFKGITYYLAVAFAYVAILTPLVFIAICSADLLFRNNLVNKTLVLVLLGIWFVSLAGAGITITKLSFNAVDLAENDPERAEESRVITIDQSFTKVHTEDNIRVEFVTGETIEVIADGQKRSIDNLNFTVEEGVLTINNKPLENRCLFCDLRRAHITITLPSIDEVQLENGSSVSGTISGDSLLLNLKNSSRANLTLNVQNLETKLQDGSYANLTGSVRSATTSLSNSSRLEAATLKTSSMILTALNSSDAEIWVTDTLAVTAENSSRVTYLGSPRITEKNLANSARLESMREAERREGRSYDDAPEVPEATHTATTTDIVTE